MFAVQIRFVVLRNILLFYLGTLQNSERVF
jgi:hypothetical protein